MYVKSFRVCKIFVHKFLLDLQSFHSVFKITISKIRDLVAFSLILLINMLLRSVSVLVIGILFNRSNGLMIKYLTNSMFDELKAVNFKSLIMYNTLKRNKIFEESSGKSRCVFRTQASIHDGAFS